METAQYKLKIFKKTKNLMEGFVQLEAQVFFIWNQ